MSKKPLDRTEEQRKDILKAQKKAASAKYESEKVEQITVRVPKSERDKIQEYVKTMAAQEPDNPMYNDVARHRPSVNSYILTLIREDMNSNPVKD